MLANEYFTEQMIAAMHTGGIDLDMGITYTGSAGKYTMALQTFCAGFTAHSRALQEHFTALQQRGPEESILLLLTNETHALKGNARTIGASMLAHQAEEMELKGRRGELGGILKEMGALLEEYKRVVEVISSCINNDRQKLVKQNESIDLQDAFERLLAALAEFDDDLAATLTHTLLENTGEDLQDELQKLDEYIDDFMYDEAEELTRKLKERLKP